MLLELTGPVARLRSLGVKPGGGTFKSVIGEVISHTNAIVGKAALPHAIYYAGTLTSKEDLEGLAQDVQSVGASVRTAVMIYDYVLPKVRKDEFLKALKPASVLLMYTSGGSDYMDKVSAFKKADEDRELYLVFYRADEYGMGFHAWGRGAKGWYLTAIFNSQPYHGFDFGYGGLLVSDAELLQPCAQLQSVLWMRQGMSDFVLATRAEAMVRQAKKSNVDCSELEGLLDAIRKDAQPALAYSGAYGEELNKKRTALMEAAAKLATELKIK
jgi:hypothetical protein